MKVIAVTGGIASGKSTVANILNQQFKIPVIDSDHLAKDLLTHNQASIDKVKAKFGENILNHDKTINRKKLGEVVFENADHRIWLEKLLHPLINSTLRSQVADLKNHHSSPYCLVLIPLITKEYLLNNDFIDQVLVIDSEKAHQITRASVRDNHTNQHIESIINNQISSQERLLLADYVIHNNDDLHELEKQTIKFHHDLLQSCSL